MFLLFFVGPQGLYSVGDLSCKSCSRLKVIYPAPPPVHVNKNDKGQAEEQADQSLTQKRGDFIYFDGLFYLLNNENI